MAARGDRASTHQLAVLREHRAPQLAAQSKLNRRTAERALAGEAVHPLCLRALLEAAELLSGRPGTIAPQVTPNAQNAAA